MYTTHGLMTGADMAEIRADYDLDLCGCCESGAAPRLDELGDCTECGDAHEAHA